MTTQAPEKIIGINALLDQIHDLQKRVSALEIRMYENCVMCAGSGHLKCGQCFGKGCPRCGQMGLVPCPTCGGTGKRPGSDDR